MTVHDVLVAARKRIENPANWGKAGDVCSPDTTCAFLAILDSEEIGDRYTLGFFRKQVGGSIITWNDAPERTHAEVLAAFDRAIEMAAQE